MKGGVARDGHGRPVVWSIGMNHGTAVEMQRQMVYIMERVAVHALPGMPPHATCMVIDIAPRDKGAPATFRFPDRDVRTLFDLQGRLLPGAAYSTYVCVVLSLHSLGVKPGLGCVRLFRVLRLHRALSHFVPSLLFYPAVCYVAASARMGGSRWFCPVAG